MKVFLNCFRNLNCFCSFCVNRILIVNDNNNKGEVKLEIEDIMVGVKIACEELEEYFETIKKNGIKIRGDTIYNVERSNVKIGVKKNKK